MASNPTKTLVIKQPRNRLTDVETHFAFGENWKSFLAEIDQDSITGSDGNIRRLLSPEELADRSAIDIGSGSGLAALSLIRHGAKRVDCVDIDAASVEATTLTLSRYAPSDRWTARRISVLDLPDQPYDIVHSWGVLHHTGAMWPSIHKAASLVAPGGLFAVAIYRRTPLCDAWKIEKRFYSASPKPIQLAVRKLFETCCILGMAAKGRDPFAYIRDYSVQRGMSWHHDQHDWLGGYPYESATPEEMTKFLEERGFRLRKHLPSRPTLGLTGVGCDEYVFERSGSTPSN